MATFDLGRVTPLYKGDYSASASYELNDVVLYNGNLYWHVQATATVGILPTDTTAWKLAFADEGVRAEIRGYADNAQNSADSASASKTAAAQSASQASASASQAALSAQAAQTAGTGATASAQTASMKASEATASAQTAASSAQTATDKATLASQKAAAASESASLATAKASAAATSETNAATSAQTATTKASEAAASATSAQEYDESAQASAVNAQTAQGLAETAQTAAETAQGLAEDARDLAQQYAESIDPENIYSAYPTDTASGAVASFPDGADGIPLKSLVVDINPVQSGSGDPSPDNVRPISGWTGCNVQRTGFNVWDEEWEVGGYAGSTGAAWDTNTRIRSKTTNYISVLPNTTYYVNMPSGAGLYLDIIFYNAGKTFISSTNPNAGTTFTTPSDARFMRFASGAAYGTTYNHDISINYPATDTDYHEGHVQSINISLGQTVYGGKLDVTNGVLTVDMAMVDLGTLTWARLAAGDNYVFYTTDISKANNFNFLCSQYANSHASRLYMPDKTCGATNTTMNVFCIRDDIYTENDVFKSAMSGVQLCYEFATPITIQLTPHKVNSLLGTNNIYADTGDTNVEYRADPTLYISKKIAEAISALS